MKTLTGILLFVLLGINANGQQSVGGKILAETSVMSEKIVKGAPFSADAVNESVQVLVDGNRIVRSSTNKLYRNSEGRFRREISGSSGGSLSTFYSIGPGITILDPVEGHRYLLDSHLKTARIGSLSGFGIAATVPGAVKPAPPAQPAKAATAPAPDKIKEELKAATAVGVISPKAYSDAFKFYNDALTMAQNGSFVYSAQTAKPRYESRTEDLGVQTIEGVQARGTRTITTIPAGDIGNERPIDMIYEKWYSDELQLVILSKHSDPRFGEQTYRLTNIVRSEPDPSLFELPSGYKILSEPAASFTINTSRGGQNRNVVWTKASGQGPATTVKSTKP